MKMQLEYAAGFITKGRAGHWRTVSCHNNILVIEDLEIYPFESPVYLGTELKFGQLQTDENNYVVFTRAKPVIDRHTKFSLS